MPDRQSCIECGKQSPETETNYTLISAQFGWRLARSKAADGSLVIEWRCPTCWRNFKRVRGAASTADLPGKPASEPPASVPKGSGAPGRPPSGAPKADDDAKSPSQRARPRRDPR